MMVLGVLLIALSLPLLIGYFTGGKKNISWRNLGAIMAAIGVVIAIIPQ
jgi:mannitol-specific phosphotransferase system IIBC component